MRLTDCLCLLALTAAQVALAAAIPEPGAWWLVLGNVAFVAVGGRKR